VDRMIEAVPQKFTKESLDKIKKANFLSQDNLDSLKQMQKSLEHSYMTQQRWRTETEIKYSVLNDMSFPTWASKYWQSVREQMSFLGNLTQLAYDFEHEKIKMERLVIKKEEIEYKIKQKRKEITDDNKIEIDFQIRKLQLDLQDNDLDISQSSVTLLEYHEQGRDRMREIKIWETVKNDCLKNDPSIDTNDVNSHQLESYQKRWETEMELGAKLHQPDLFKNSMASLNTIKDKQPLYDTDKIKELKE